MNKKKIKNKKRKVLHVILIILIFLIIILGSLFINNYNKELEYHKSLTIKIGDNLPDIYDYLDENNLKRLDSKQIKWNDIKLEDNKIYIAGNYNGYITFRKKKINLELKVIDDEKPVIENVKDITINKNDTINLLENIKVKDNSHSDIEIKVLGEYDTSKAGEYPLTYIATDKSGNEVKSEFKLIVKEKKVKIEAPTTTTQTTPIQENINIGTTSNGYTIKKINGVYYINDVLIANKTYALPSTYSPGGLSSTFNNEFNNMKSAAANQGITLNIISGYRSYWNQNSIYNNYVNKDGKGKADTYSARPGHSEHQTGLAADINSLYSSFINTPEGKWLNDNCYKYGFIIRYPKGKENITGYMYEPWHIRYVGTDISNTLYNNGNWISLEEYLGITSKYDY